MFMLQWLKYWIRVHAWLKVCKVTVNCYPTYQSALGMWVGLEEPCCSFQLLDTFKRFVWLMLNMPSTVVLILLARTAMPSLDKYAK
jgi:hypothetical protein